LPHLPQPWDWAVRFAADVELPDVKKANLPCVIWRLPLDIGRARPTRLAISRCQWSRKWRERVERQMEYQTAQFITPRVPRGGLIAFKLPVRLAQHPDCRDLLPRRCRASRPRRRRSLSGCKVGWAVLTWLNQRDIFVGVLCAKRVEQTPGDDAPILNHVLVFLKRPSTTGPCLGQRRCLSAPDTGGGRTSSGATVLFVGGVTALGWRGARLVALGVIAAAAACLARH
jgi:hypothetical protein